MDEILFAVSLNRVWDIQRELYDEVAEADSLLNQWIVAKGKGIRSMWDPVAKGACDFVVSTVCMCVPIYIHEWDQFVLQLRTADAPTSPSKISSFGGAPLPGEALVDGWKRETYEELGFEASAAAVVPCHAELVRVRGLIAKRFVIGVQFFGKLPRSYRLGEGEAAILTPPDRIDQNPNILDLARRDAAALRRRITRG